MSVLSNFLAFYYRGKYFGSTSYKLKVPRASLKNWSLTVFLSKVKQKSMTRYCLFFCFCSGIVYTVMPVLGVSNRSIEIVWNICFFCYIPLALKCYIASALCGHTSFTWRGRLLGVQSQVDQLWLLCLLFHLSCLSSGLRFRAVSVQRLLQMQSSCPNWKTVPDGCMAQHIPKLNCSLAFSPKAFNSMHSNVYIFFKFS